MKKENKQKQGNNVAELEIKIQELATMIDKVEDEKLLVENQLKRALADYDNLVKNSQKRDELRFFQIKKNLCEQIIPSLDSIMMASKASEEITLDENGKAWLQGIMAILESISKNMEDLGLKQYMPAKGDKFDNNIHEAIATVPNGEKGTIFEVIQPGYILNDSVIRPSRVVVSK